MWFPFITLPLLEKKLHGLAISSWNAREMGERAGKIRISVNPLAITFSCLVHQNIPALFIPDWKAPCIRLRPYKITGFPDRYT
jgi:hypothetical protein